MANRTRTDELSDSIARIEDFERHEDEVRATHSIEAAFNAIEGFAEQERLMVSLWRMALGIKLPIEPVLNALWEQFGYWKTPELKAKTLMHLVWFASPQFPWMRPLEEVEVARAVATAMSSPLQLSLHAHDSTLWSLLEAPSTELRAAASLVLALRIDHDADQLILMLDAMNESEDSETFRSSILMAVGRAGQYAKHLYGVDTLEEVCRMLEASLDSSRIISGTFAVSVKVVAA